MYAIILGNLIHSNMHTMEETVVYELALFEVSDQQRVLNPVANPLVIIFTERTIVQMVLHSGDMFPEWTYRLTPIMDLPAPSDLPRRFIDVIRVIRGISNVSILNMSGRNFPVSSRDILIADESGNEIKVTLWGGSAYQFNGLDISALGQTESAIIIFVHEGGISTMI